MKKFTLTLCALAACTTVFGQRTTKVVDMDQVKAMEVTYQPRLNQILHNGDVETIVSNKQVVPMNSNQATPAAKTALSAVTLGRASNAFTILRTEQNQVTADEESNTVAFIHRQDVTIWGGGGSASGLLRVDISMDGGQTFTNDIGTLNGTSGTSTPARYPNIAYINDGTEGRLVYSAATLNSSPDWYGHVVGNAAMSSVNTAGQTLTSTEQYIAQGDNSLIPGGMALGANNTFYTTEVAYIGGATVDSFIVRKGEWNSSSQTFDWSRADANAPNLNSAADGATHFTTDNIAFSPDGQTGWNAFLGDLVGGHDSAYAPIFRKSTDGGATWGSWVEFDLRTISWIRDSLQILWVDSSGAPAASGLPTTAFDFDLTVDGDGNPHMITVVGNMPADGTPYSISSGLAMFVADVYSTDGGTTWSVDYIAPCLRLRGEFGNASDPLIMDNQPQISRSEDGAYIYYSWVDTDTCITGLTSAGNTNPNLRIAGKRVSDNYRTQYKLITDGDIIWDGVALFPTMAATGIRKANNTNHHLPIVMLNILFGDQLQPCEFAYFGSDAVLYEADFKDPATLELSWQNCPVVSQQRPEPVSQIQLFQSFPNPTNGTATVPFELPVSDVVTLELVNMYGQQVGVLASGKFNAGMNQVTVNTNDLAAGLYFYNLKVGDKVFTKKMTVTK